MYARVTLRSPRGEIPRPCICGDKIVSASAAIKYRTNAAFVHTYHDADCTQWNDTQVLHIGCWAKIRKDLGLKIVEEVDDRS